MSEHLQELCAIFSKDIKPCLEQACGELLEGNLWFKCRPVAPAPSTARSVVTPTGVLCFQLRLTQAPTGVVTYGQASLWRLDRTESHFAVHTPTGRQLRCQALHMMFLRQRVLIGWEKKPIVWGVGFENAAWGCTRRFALILCQKA